MKLLSKPILLLLLCFNIASSHAQDINFLIDEESGLYGLARGQKWVVKPRYLDHGYFSEGMAWVRTNKGVGFVDKTGALVIADKYKYASNFNNGKVMVSFSDKETDKKTIEGFFFIDKTGRIAGEKSSAANLEINRYENGKKVGEWRYYEKNGRLTASEYFNSAGRLHGNASSYFRHTSAPVIKSLKYFSEGKQTGISTFYHPNGNRAFTEEWENGTFKQVRSIFDNNGNSISLDGSGMITTYDENGNVYYRGSYENGKRSGVSEWYFDNGQLKQKVLYKYTADSPTGLAWEILGLYSRAGKQLPKGTLKNGNGTWILYDGNFSPTTVRSYKNGVYQGEVPYTASSNSSQTTSSTATTNDSAELLKLGRQQYKAKKYELALGTFKKAADKGEVEALTELGLLYYQGLGTAKDYKKAFEWFTKAAGKKEHNALYWLGVMHESGLGTAKDEKKAFAYYSESAYLDNPLGIYATGLCYYWGIGTNKNMKQALETLAILRNDELFETDAEYLNTLAYCYFENGELNMAIKTLDWALENNKDYGNGFDSLGEIYLKSGNKTKAIENYKKAAALGHENAKQWLKDNGIK